MKKGIDYFPLDVALDEKWDLIEAEFGLTGFGVVVKILQKIYGGQGYYVEWTNEVALVFAHRVGLGASAVSEIVAASIRRGIFDKDIFDKYHILTSRGIQQRYFEAVSRRNDVKVEKRFLLIDCTHFLKNVNISEENVNISEENVNISEQSKVEESKVKYSRVDNTASADAIISAYTSDKQIQDLLHDWLKIRKAKRVAYTESAVKGNLAKLDDFARQSGLSVAEYLQEVIRRGWAAFYDVDSKPQRGGKSHSLPYDKAQEPSDYSEYEESVRSKRLQYKKGEVI